MLKAGVDLDNPDECPGAIRLAADQDVEMLS
jgi:hypothetical protein